MNWVDEVKKEEQFEKVLTFDEYIKIFENHPRRECRVSSMYLKDMFNYFGKGENGSFNLFTRDHSDSPPVSGQIRTQELIYSNLENFTEEGFNNKFILLVGPNGSSKSSIVKKIMKATEDYSRSDEGALFTFSWIFPISKFTKGSVGFANDSSKGSVQSYAQLEDSEISSILQSEMKDHPILLIPIKARQSIINKAFADQPELLESIQKSYLYTGDLSKRNRLIFDALLKNHNGEYTEVMKHIRVERFHIDKRYSTGAATIEPQLHVDAKLQQITMDKRLANLPPSLQSLNLFNLSGEIVLGNRGILEFSDLLKRPLDTYKYLLMTMETRTINLQGILTELDIFFIGSSNEVHLAAFKQHPDFNSFKGRFNFIKVPYLTNVHHEVKIYEDQVHNLKDHTKFEPHAIEALCYWAVMTRLRQPQAKNFADKKLGDIAQKLTPMEKAVLIADTLPPEYLDSEGKQLLKLSLPELQKEFLNDALYEGKFGISPREIKQMIYELSNEYESISFIEIGEYLKEISEKKNEYDFLNIGPQGDYHNCKKFIYQIEQNSLNQFDGEVRECLGLVDNRSYEDYIGKYIGHVNALIKKEKIKNLVTGKFEEPDMYFVKEFESNIHLKESADDFRGHVMSRLGAYYLDNPNKKIVYCDVLDDIVKLLKESFRNEQKKIINTVAENFIFYLTELNDKKEGKAVKTGLNQDGRQLIEDIISKLSEKYNYSEKGAINLLKYLITKRYDNKS